MKDAKQLRALNSAWHQHEWHSDWRELFKLLRAASAAELIDSNVAKEAEMILSNNPHMRLNMLGKKLSELKATCGAFMEASSALARATSIIEKDLDTLAETCNVMARFQADAPTPEHIDREEAQDADI